MASKLKEYSSVFTEGKGQRKSLAETEGRSDNSMAIAGEEPISVLGIRTQLVPSAPPGGLTPFHGKRGSTRPVVSKPLSGS